MDSFGQTNPVASVRNIIKRISEVGEKLNTINRKHIELLPDILQNKILYQIIHKTLKLLKIYFELQIHYNQKVKNKASNYSILSFYFNIVDMINQMYLKKIIFIYEIVDSGIVERYYELPPYLLNDMEADEHAKTLSDNVKNFLTGLALNNIDFLQENLDKLKEMAKNKLSKLKEGNLVNFETVIKENIELVADQLEEKITELNEKIDKIDNTDSKLEPIDNTNTKGPIDKPIEKKKQNGGNNKYNKIYDPYNQKWEKINTDRGINLLNIYYKNGYIF
jgi:hypothetical protein